MIKLNDDTLIKEYIYEKENVVKNNTNKQKSFFDKIKNFLGI